MAEMTFVICVQNEGYPASLELRKVYQVFPDVERDEHQMLRISDESGEDYLYPANYFMKVELPKPVQDALLKAA